jgi:hypothetical protein
MSAAEAEGGRQSRMARPLERRRLSRSARRLCQDGLVSWTLRRHWLHLEADDRGSLVVTNHRVVFRGQSRAI